MTFSTIIEPSFYKLPPPKKVAASSKRGEHRRITPLRPPTQQIRSDDCFSTLFFSCSLFSRFLCDVKLIKFQNHKLQTAPPVADPQSGIDTRNTEANKQSWGIELQGTGFPKELVPIIGWLCEWLIFLQVYCIWMMWLSGDQSNEYRVSHPKLAGICSSPATTLIRMSDVEYGWMRSVYGHVNYFGEIPSGALWFSLFPQS